MNSSDYYVVIYELKINILHIILLFNINIYICISLINELST